jgi:hypothetical protein
VEFDLAANQVRFFGWGDGKAAKQSPLCASRDVHGTKRAGIRGGAEPSDRCVVGRVGFSNIRGVRHAAARLLNLIGSSVGPLMVTCAWRGAGLFHPALQRGARVLGVYSVADDLLAGYTVRTVSPFFSSSSSSYWWHVADHFISGRHGAEQTDEDDSQANIFQKKKG